MGKSGLLLALDQRHRLRLLRRMRMVGARVDLQLGELLAREAVSRQHALYRQPDDFLGTALQHVVQRAGLQAARVTRVAGGHLFPAPLPPPPETPWAVPPPDAARGAGGGA